ncbi:MAG: hypothetical protein Q4P15_01120 [Propionibacteriaceae bacterium]|nr:hypothetical protein [Propionibacteriaceae bacterium]
MSESDENQDIPVDAQPEGLGDPAQWRNVPQPSTEQLLAHSTQAVDPPKMPLLVKVGGLTLVALLLLMALWLGLTLGEPGSTEAVPTPTVEEEPPWPLEPPVSVGNMVKGESASPSSAPAGREIARANYSDGSVKVLLLLSRPEDDLEDYLANLRVEEVEAVGDAKCGMSADTQLPVCARIIDETAIAVAGLSEQEFQQLASLVESFYAAMQ